MWNDALALNRLTRLVVMAALVYAAFVALRWAASQPVFAIRTISVQALVPGAAADGAAALDHVHAAQVAQYCVPRITGTFFTNDLEITRAAFEALPWVRRASVRRHWPNRLVVTIEEHRALARWNDEDGNRFVSVLGEAFNAPGEKAIGAALPLLLGPEGSEKEVALRYGEFRQRLAAIDQMPAVVALSPRQAWTIRLARVAATGPAAAPAHDGLLLDLGREQPRAPVLARLDRFVAHHGATLGRIGARIEAVDLRYPNGFAARIPGFQAVRASAGRQSTTKQTAGNRAAAKKMPAARPAQKSASRKPEAFRP